MELNSIIFRKPNPTYNFKDIYGNIIFIPKVIDDNFEIYNSFFLSNKIKEYYNNEGKSNLVPKHFHQICIPCLFIPSPIGSSKLLIYFHGNAEDIGCTINFLGKIIEEFGVHVISVEYPGYGIYPGTPKEKDIIADAEIIINFLIKFGQWKEENIILFGRSIGSGPASHLASRYSVGCLILMSGFTNLQAVIKNHVGIFQTLVKDRFRNIDKIPFVKCPIFLLHGKKDDIVPYEHSQILHKSTRTYSKIVIPEDMDHNQFDFQNDFNNPFAQFCNEINLNFRGDEILYLPIPSFFEPKV